MALWSFKVTLNSILMNRTNEPNMNKCTNIARTRSLKNRSNNYTFMLRKHNKAYFCSMIRHVSTVPLSLSKHGSNTMFVIHAITYKRSYILFHTISSPQQRRRVFYYLSFMSGTYFCGRPIEKKKRVSKIILRDGGICNHLGQFL